MLLDPTGYPNPFGDHPRQAVLVHDLSMFERNLYRRGKRTWFRLFYRRALRKAQLRICVSEYTRGELIARATAQRETLAIHSIDLAKARDKAITPANHLLRDRRPEHYA